MTKSTAIESSAKHQSLNLYYKFKLIFVSAVLSTTLGYATTALSQLNADYSAVPPTSEETDPPQVMLSMSRDHQYFFKAYNDYTDLDPEDGLDEIETTYKHDFDYFGYFDSYKCYTHDGAKFSPTVVTADKYCTNEWSGNFLNWATMTRMDIVRSILYGGYRSTDTSSSTILERSYLPTDAHSFAKYYNGADLAQLIPASARGGAFSDADIALGGDNDGFDDIDEGITLCNTTYEASGTSRSSTSPPLIRIAEGNYQLWASNERWQCTWSNERGNQSNSNVPPSAPITITVGGVNVDIDSGIDAHTNDPAENIDLIARVEACVSDTALHGTENCKQYPDGNYKPVGILQTYGDSGLINFGLMTGSYANNIEGGVLRKNTGPLNDEIDVTGDGTFTYALTGDSIVKTINLLRPTGYNYGNGGTGGTYRGTHSATGGRDNCDFQLGVIPDGRCNAWGNPISEVFKETVRYIAGLAPDADFDADDTDYLPGLTTATWQDNLADQQCADLNTIIFNASVSSYDDDNTAIDGVPGGLNGTSTNATTTTTDTWTNLVGTSEGIPGNDYFVGRSGANTNEFCDAKTITNLSDAFGLCPEAPTVSGSFAMVGIAYYAHNNDLRADLEGNQTLNTFAISLATNVPIIKVPRSNPDLRAIEILPAYRLLDAKDASNNTGVGLEGGGALVDFKQVKPHTQIGTTNRFEGSYYINWEDSEQGGDYDQDMWGLLNYVLDEDLNTITISTTAVTESTGGGQLFGFVTNGTTTDGFHAYSGIEGADFTSPFAGIPGCTNCYGLNESGKGGFATGQFGPQSHTFTLADSTAESLESPLFYAAKYGGFDENLAAGETVTLTDAPDEIDEWDAFNNVTGALEADGLPDNYFFVTNPARLFDSLETALQKILSQLESANSSVANFANADGFGNLIVQAGYQELKTDDDLNEVTWTGTLDSYFIDNFGLFREDTNGNGILDDYATDRAFDYVFDELTKITTIQYYSPTFDTLGNLNTEDDGRPTHDGGEQSVEDLKTLWSAADSLSNLDNDTITEQRTYSSQVNPTSGASRYIFTYLDEDQDGVVDAGEQVDFTSTVIDNDTYQFLGVGSETVADDIVDYIRGYEEPGSAALRNRTLIEDGSEVTYRLGDIVNSTPTIVANPTQAYDSIFEDSSYAAFRTKYEGRRTVIYAGANDGLLHAFNGGFKQEGVVDDGDTATIDEITVGYTTTTSNGETAHPLGTELWAYAPYNLLPHMQWLSSGFYNHVFYVDGSPQTFEAKIFTADDDHPGGWGTILVVGMRLGGGDFPLMLADGSTSTTRSAYIVMDVTNPEEEPVLLAEISHPNLNFTTSKPDLFYDCDIYCSATGNTKFNGNWTLVFGSGPNNLKTFETTETAKIFTFDLESLTLDEHEVSLDAGTTLANSFVGGVSTRDWDGGEPGYRNDDILYFGTVGTRALVSGETDGEDNDGLVETGALVRFDPRDEEFSMLYDAQRPIGSAPLTLSNEALSVEVTSGGSTILQSVNVLGSWVYFGTGIYQKQDDDFIAQTERFYGILEPVDTGELTARLTADFDASLEDSDLLLYTEVTESDLVDVTAVGVYSDAGEDDLPTGVVEGDLDSSLDGGNVTNFTELREYIVTENQGWYRDLPNVVDTAPSTRLATEISFLQTQLFFSTYTPSSLEREDICIGGEGNSDLFIIDLTTGTASPFASLGVIDEGGSNDGLALASIETGSGLASTPQIFTSEELGGDQAIPIIRRSGGSTDRIIPPGDPSITISGTEFERSGWREIF